MSTDYRFLTPIDKKTFLEAVKACNLIIDSIVFATNEEDGKICVSCGEFYLWFYVNKNADSECISYSSRYGANYEAQSTILDVLSSALQVGYLSEHDEGYFVDEDEEF